MEEDKDKILLDEVISALKDSCIEYGAHSADISFATPDGWRVSISVTNLLNP